MNTLVSLLPRRPRWSRLIRTIHRRLAAPSAAVFSRAAHSDGLWRTYVRLADSNVECSEEPGFYLNAAAMVQAVVQSSAREKTPVSSEHLIEVIVRALASPCLLSSQELGLIRARLTVAVAEVRAGVGHAPQTPVVLARAELVAQ